MKTVTLSLFKKLTGVCIQAVVHLPLQGCFIFSLVKYKPLTYNKVYEYPDWAVGIGWTLALTSMICIPMVVVIKIIRSDGPLIEVGPIAVCCLAVTSESSVYPPYLCECSTTQNIRISLLYVSCELANILKVCACLCVWIQLSLSLNSALVRDFGSRSSFSSTFDLQQSTQNMQTLKVTTTVRC